MKAHRVFKIIALFSVLAVMSTSCFATELAPEGTKTRKLQRGFLNVLTSPMELTHEWSEAKERDNPLDWAFFAIPKGLLDVACRASVGIYEMVTFPFTKKNEPILESEIGWDLLDE